MQKVALLLIAASSWCCSASAATIPAGATLVVRINETLSSDDQRGTPFQAELAQDVAVDGRVLLRAGTKVRGQVESGRMLAFSPVVLNVKQLVTRGGAIPIKTTGGFRADGNLFHTRRGVGVGRGGFFQIPAGTIMRFQLARPINA